MSSFGNTRWFSTKELRASVPWLAEPLLTDLQIRSARTFEASEEMEEGDVAGCKSEHRAVEGGGAGGEQKEDINAENRSTGHRFRGNRSGGAPLECPTGFDPIVWVELPRSLQQELIEERERNKKPGEVCPEGIDPQIWSQLSDAQKVELILRDTMEESGFLDAL